MDIEEMKNKLKLIESITFTKHFKVRVETRGISEEEVLSHLKSPKSLVHVEYQGEENQRHKYSLLFEKSSKYDLKIVVSIKEKALNVVTTHIQNKRKRKVLEKWLKTRR